MDFPSVALHIGYMDDLGQRIRAARERRMMTQQELADLVEVDKKTVGNWERGRTHPRNRLGKVVEVLGLEMTSLEQAEEDIRRLRGISPEERDDLIARLRARRGGGHGAGGANGEPGDRRGVGS